MEPGRVSQVRRFNRLVTQRVGALSDRFLGSDHPLGEARVLWEIGPDGRDVRELRAQLGLDSGYLSRLLRSLEETGTVTVRPSTTDRRVRIARLTQAGRVERDTLDQRSDDLAESLLEPLSGTQRDRLVAAMADVERLLTAAMVEVGPVDPARPDARHCIRAYVAELDRRFEAGFDPSRSISAAEEEMRPPHGVFLLASLQGKPIGCGGLKFHDRSPAEVKRMWVSESARGLGIGRRLLQALESHAAARNVRVLRLETNGTLTEAISLYRSAGYAEVAPFNNEPYAHHWFEKRILPNRRTAPRGR